MQGPDYTRPKSRPTQASNAYNVAAGEARELGTESVSAAGQNLSFAPKPSRPPSNRKHFAPPPNPVSNLPPTPQAQQNGSAVNPGSSVSSLVSSAKSQKDDSVPHSTPRTAALKLSSHDNSAKQSD